MSRSRNLTKRNAATKPRNALTKAALKTPGAHHRECAVDLFCADTLKDQHRENRPDRVVDDAFELQDGAHRSPWTRMTQQRADDRWACHDENRPEKKGELDSQAQEVVRRRRQNRPSDRDPEHDQSPNRRRDTLDLLPTCAEPAFEKNDRRRQRNEREHERSENLVRREKAGQRPCDEADGRAAPKSMESSRAKRSTASPRRARPGSRCR